MKTLREKLLAELKANPRGYPTWWVKERLNDGTTNAEARKEFQRMEREGLVTRRSSCSNCIVWWTNEGEASQRQREANLHYKWSREYEAELGRIDPASLQYGRYRNAVVDHQRKGATRSAEARKLMGVE